MPALPLPLPPPPMRCDAMRCITVRGYIPAPLKQDSSSAKAETGVSWSRISNVHVGRGRRRRQGTVSYVRHDTVVSGCCRARCSHRLNGWRPQRLLLGSLSLSILMRGSGAHLTRQRVQCDGPSSLNASPAFEATQVFIYINGYVYNQLYIIRT